MRMDILQHTQDMYLIVSNTIACILLANSSLINQTDLLQRFESGWAKGPSHINHIKFTY